MTIIEALALIIERDMFNLRAAETARKAVAVNSPIRVKRVIAVLDDTTRGESRTLYSDDEVAAMQRAAADYVRANPDSQ
jgi:hypothetical protein